MSPSTLEKMLRICPLQEIRAGKSLRNSSSYVPFKPQFPTFHGYCTTVVVERPTLQGLSPTCECLEWNNDLQCFCFIDVLPLDTVLPAVVQHDFSAFYAHTIPFFAKSRLDHSFKSFVDEYGTTHLAFPFHTFFDHQWVGSNDFVADEVLEGSVLSDQ